MIHPYTSPDVRPLVTLFTETLHKISSSYYSPAEIKAWANQCQSIEEWSDFFKQKHTLVEERDGELLGFGCLSSDADYIDMLYTHHAQQNEGIGSALLKALEDEAIRRGAHDISLTTSATAWHFYLARGYQYHFSRKQTYGGMEFDCQILRKALTPLKKNISLGDSEKKHYVCGLDF